MNDQDLLLMTIRECENGGIKNENFLKNAHEIYNGFATFPCPLFDAKHPYLLGIVFAEFAQYYSEDVNTYGSIMENALFCFFRTIKTSESPSEQKAAAMRLLVLIKENEWIMKGVARKFYEQRHQDLYRAPAGFGAGAQTVFQSIMKKTMSTGLPEWTYELDILKCIKYHCLEISNQLGTICVDDNRVFLSESFMYRFNVAKQDNYSWPLVDIPRSKVFEYFSEFIAQVIIMPYERRITRLNYKKRND